MNEFSEEAQKIIEKSGNNPLYSLTVTEFEILVKSWMSQVIKSEQPEAEEKLITRQEACDFLRCSYPTVISYQKRGLLTGRRIGHKFFYDKNEIENALRRVNDSEAPSGIPPSRVPV